MLHTHTVSIDCAERVEIELEERQLEDGRTYDYLWIRAVMPDGSVFRVSADTRIGDKLALKLDPAAFARCMATRVSDAEDAGSVPVQGVL